MNTEVVLGFCMLSASCQIISALPKESVLYWNVKLDCLCNVIMQQVSTRKRFY